MRYAVLKAAALSLWRDKPALSLTFLLPPAIYAVFALVFSSATGGEVKIALGVSSPDTDIASHVVSILETSEDLARFEKFHSREELHAAVQNGSIDAGIAIIDNGENQPPDFHLFKNATREAAGLTAEKVLSTAKPELEESDVPQSELTHVTANPANLHTSMQAYYAAGVAMLFLFLSGFQSALTILEERDAGVMERAAVLQGGIGPIIDGKFVFIFLQGLLQVAVIIAVAIFAFGVEVSLSPLTLVAAAFAASICASGLTLGVTALCQSKAQAHAVGAILSLVLGAIGGSMAPAFLMPATIKAIGALTPIGLGISAFAPALWSGGGFSAAKIAIIGLMIYGAVGLLLARTVSRRNLSASV